jgi:hypothetical protein
MNIRKPLLLFLLGCFAILTVYGQEISEKKDVAVFNLSYYDWNIPNEALGMIDEQIKGVFVSLGRFDVVGMNYRVGSENINDFIEKIRELKQQDVEIPESVQLGREAFTEADFNKIINSFLVVIPTVTYYEVTTEEDGDNDVRIETSFSVIDVDEAQTIARFTVETTGIDKNLQKAIKEAVDNIPLRLTYEIRKVPEFQLKTGIVDVIGPSEVVLEFGTNMGVAVGDEYAIVEKRTLQSGHVVTDPVGLMVIKEVKRDISYAKVLYSKRPPRIGDQLQEVPRLGFDTSLYVNSLLGFEGSLFNGVIVGLRQSLSRGLYTLRPVVGLEVPFLAAQDDKTTTEGVPLSVYAGGELNWYFGRVQIVPMAAIGLGGQFYGENQKAEGESPFAMTHGGFVTNFSINVLITDNIRVFVQGGYSYWFDFEGVGNSYGGVTAGLGGMLRW